jgi:hypothetical protein
MRRLIILPLFLMTCFSYAQVGEKFSDELEVYNFELPFGLFQKKNNDLFVSKKLSASIKFRSVADYIGEDNNADIKSQFKIMKLGLNVKYEFLGKETFTISGINSFGQIVYIIGRSETLMSKNGCDDCVPIGMWTKTMIVSFTYPLSSKKAMDSVIAKFVKTYHINLFLL